MVAHLQDTVSFIHIFYIFYEVCGNPYHQNIQNILRSSLYIVSLMP